MTACLFDIGQEREERKLFRIFVPWVGLNVRRLLMLPRPIITWKGYINHCFSRIHDLSIFHGPIAILDIIVLRLTSCTTHCSL